MGVTIIGVYPIVAPEPCHMIELKFDNPVSDFDWGRITQQVEGQPRANWQAVYDEQRLDNKGQHWVFFMHYLDFSRSLITPDGLIPLPAPSPLPPHLSHIYYEAPD